MSAETPAAAPERTPETPEPETGTDAPLSVADAWGDVLVAVSRVEPADDLSRAVAAAARANIRAEIERTKQPTITDETLLAFQFMQRLGDVLAMVERNKAASTAAVMDALFAGHPRAPNNRVNGAFGP